MSKNFGQTGVANDLQYGKAGGRIIYSGGKFSIYSADGVTFTDVDVAVLTGTTVNAGDLTLATNTITNSEADSNVVIVGSGTGIVQVEGVSFDGTTITAEATNASLTIEGNGTGSVNVEGLNVNGSTITSTATDANITLTPDGTGLVVASNLQVSDLTDTRVVFAGTSGRLVDSSNFTFTTGTGSLSVTGDITVDNLKLDGNTISSTNSNGNVVIEPNGTGTFQVTADDSTFSGDVAITGDLLVSGTTTTVNTQDLIVEDNIIGLNKGIDDQTTNAFDTGILLFRGNEDSAAFIWKEADDKFVLGTTADSSIGAPGTITVTAGDLLVATLEATQVDVGDLSLAGSTITGTDTDANIELAPNGDGVVVISGKTASDYADDIDGIDEALTNKKYVDDSIAAAESGAAAGNITSVKGVVDLTSATVQDIGSLIPINSDVLRVYMDVTTNTGATATTVTLGYSGSPSVFMTADENDPQETGLFVADLRHNVGGTARQAQATVATAAASGSATVIIEFRLPS